MEIQPTKELLKKLIELEESQKHLKQEMSRLKVSTELRQRSNSVTPYLPATRNIGEGAPALKKSGAASFLKESRIQGSMNLMGGVVGAGGPSARKFTNQQYLNILQSVGQTVHVFDLNMQTIFWNAMSEKTFGYSAAEVVGKNPIKIIVDERDTAFGMEIAHRCLSGETWTGEFPVKTKSGVIFSAVTTCSPFYDDDGSLFGIISITSDSSPYMHPRASSIKMKAQEGETSSSPAKNNFVSKLGLASKGAVISKLGLDSDQPIQVAITSKISSLASKMSNKVRSKMQAGDSSVTLPTGGSGDIHHSAHGLFCESSSDDAVSSGASNQRGDFIHPPFGVFTYDDENFLLKPSQDSSDGKSAIHKLLTSKTEEWIAKKGLLWPRKRNEQEGSKERPTHSVWPSVQNEQEKDKSHQIKASPGVKYESHYSESSKPTNSETSSSWSSSLIANNTSCTSSCGSTNSSVTDNDCLEYEILSDDLTIGERIGQGSCGTVYHGLWLGSDVAVKVFSKQDFSEEVLQSFRQEVSLMKRLRHPNVLLFMGAVTSTALYCVRVPSTWKSLPFIAEKYYKTGLEAAYPYSLGHCSRPPIIHRDLKSSNLLVDRNWTVKVADFGLSRIKHETFLTSKSGKGTPQWMAPEVLRHESADEKSDIYSFGVVLWELATGKIPWETLNSMQVIGAVGFMNQRLEIPEDIDPRWISLIESCWHSDMKLRPTFQELMEKLRDLQRKYTMQFQATRAALLEEN